MLRILSLAALSAVALLTAPVAAVRAEIVSTGLPTERSIPLRLAAGPAGRAIVLIGGTGSFAERSDSGHWAVRTLPAPGLVPAFPALGPDGAAAMLAVANHAGGGIDAFVLRRSSRGEPFEAPVAVDLGGLVYDNLDGASDARGDIAVMTAVKGPDTVVRGVIATAAAGGPFGAAQVFAPGGAEGAIVAVGAGRVVLTYYRGQGIYGRTGVVGSPLGAPQLLTRKRGTSIGAAIDDAGNATIAFDQRRRSNFDHALVVVRARPGGSFAAPAVIARNRQEFGFNHLKVAAAGTTTAMLWQAFGAGGADGEGHVAIARGDGRFGAPEAPTAPSGRHGLPILPAMAVDAAGDVLVAYPYSFEGGVHATTRRAGDARFGRLHVVTKLGEGGAPSVGFVGDRRPLVVYHGRGRRVLATTGLTGGAPDLTPPRVDVRFSPHAAAELRGTNVVTVTIRCARACLIDSHASLRTDSGGTVARGVTAKILRAGVALRERFAFVADGRAGIARAGARVRVTVHAGNASGTSRDTVEQLEL